MPGPMLAAAGAATPAILVTLEQPVPVWRQISNVLSIRMAAMAKDVEVLFSELFEAAGVGRRWGEHLAGCAGQTQARWQTLWTAASGPYTVPQIARRLGVTRQSVQRLATELDVEGLVTFDHNPDHKTSPIVTLTPAGREKLDRINAAADDMHEQLLATFPHSDVAALRTLLQRLTVTMKSLGAEEVPTS